MFVFNEPAWVIRKIKPSSPEKERHLFLTFDDGPSTELTPKILDLLKTYDAKATFFVIGNKAAKQKNLVLRMVTEGHSVLSHSLDHDYLNYFKSKSKLSAWIKRSVSQLQSLTHKNVFAFRPPAGVLTPPLLQVAQELGVCLVLWNHRFFDSVQQLNVTKVRRVIPKINAGDIILLHDQQKKKNHESFLHALEFLLQEFSRKNFNLIALTESDIPDRSIFV